jgi:hypothetical protein
MFSVEGETKIAHYRNGRTPTARYMATPPLDLRLAIWERW